MDLDIRPATKADIPDLAKLLLMATDGIVASLYEGLIPGLATHEIVERRLAREGTCGAYSNCWVATDRESRGGRIAGKLHAYPLDALAGDPPDPLVPEERYAVLAAFDALDEPAAGSYYINVIAVYPDYRGRGLGGRLLDLAREQAAARGFTQLSLAVFEENAGAVRLYERAGFAVARPCRRAGAPAHPLHRRHVDDDALRLGRQHFQRPPAGDSLAPCSRRPSSSPSSPPSSSPARSRA